jgi:hypothetical protein
MNKDKIYEKITKQSDLFLVNDKPKLPEVGIFFRGQRMRMISGKQVWNGVGPAKNALRNCLHDVGGWGNKAVDDIMKNDVGPEGSGKTFEIREL